ncbi:NlpC/P60 family protein [Streptomyces sp. NPDC006879]|uniref:C40 family peptidase n=1 Tax=Streptomyces sp. NPDC006879 TaxID=3364767 RepID=UPI00367662EA
MAAHRKPRQRPLLGSGSTRTAATLALAGAATATAYQGTSQAEPRPTTAQVKAQVDRLYQEAEAAAEKYNGAKEQAEQAQRSLEELREEAARRAERLGAARATLGSMATSQYRSGGVDPAVQLALSSDPDQYLERAALLKRAGHRQANSLATVRRGLDQVERLRKKADAKSRELSARRAELAEHKAAAERKLAEAKRVLARLTAEERARYEASNSTAMTQGPARTGGSTAQAPAPATGSRAARAVSFAYGALGKPYVWGATGPSSYDCSGLTQAAWRAAGVSLPRTTYTQINAGRRISRSQLAPGDLIFFYPGVTHVGLYIGGGKMIHAPRPGSTVRIAPIDQMPWAGATRPF